MENKIAVKSCTPLQSFLFMALLRRPARICMPVLMRL